MPSPTRKGCHEHCLEIEGFMVHPITEHGFESFWFGEKVSSSVLHELVIIC